MSNMGSQFAVPKFDGKSSFTLWQRRMKDLLVHLGLAKALKGDNGKPKKMSDGDWEEVCTKCASTIRLCIYVFSNQYLDNLDRTNWETINNIMTSTPNLDLNQDPNCTYSYTNKIMPPNEISDPSTSFGPDPDPNSYTDLMPPKVICDDIYNPFTDDILSLIVEYVKTRRGIPSPDLVEVKSLIENLKT
ncbi:hypothetical protein RND81_12G045800 [Saponaria officinalis]|uniref:Uncharacterized protein n=1 Tax=Saponaria officinalis TaxID=3572 RepID=A0AAW1H3A8_SAPOF